MSVLIKTLSGPEIAEPASFQRESELEDVVASYPQLLQGPGDSPLSFVARQVALPEAGILDLLLVSEDGLPVAVEVKLARNGESRREIIAQIIDYLSALINLTNDELDRAVSGALEGALRSFDTDPETDEFERRWQEIGVNLRGGSARIILVLDECRPELERIVRFLKERSSLDVRLVTITKCQNDNVGTVFVPQIMAASREEPALRVKAEPGVLRPGLAAVVAAYDDLAPVDLRTSGGAANYRKIKPSEWRPGFTVHYEFYQYRGVIGVELHLENDRAATLLASHLQKFVGRTIGPETKPLEWDPTWSSRRGRLRAQYPTEKDPTVAARSMLDLIALTREEVAQACAKVQAMKQGSTLSNQAEAPA